MTNVAIYDKYANAITEVLSSPTYLPLGTALLMLRLAIGDAYAAGGALADDLAAIVASQAQATPAPGPDQRVVEHAFNQIARLNEWLEQHRHDLYWEGDLDTAQAVLAALASLQAEREALRQQMVQMDADEAALRRQVVELQREVDRLTRQNVIATDTFNSLAERTNGAGPNPTTAPGWNRSHPAWEGLPKADLDVIDQLNGGLTTFRRLSATLRRDLIGRVVRHLATDGYLRQHDYETQKPGWMATATAIARYAPDYQWQTLLAEVMAEPA